MSFETLKKEQLLEIAENFGTDTQPTDTKAVIIAALAEDGVTFDQWQKLTSVAGDADEEEAIAPASITSVAVVAPAPVEPPALLKMTRANPTYEVRKVRFTRDHPFALVTEPDAGWIVENVEGFRYATPREAQEFYG